MSLKKTIRPTTFEDSSLALVSAASATISPDGSQLITGNDAGEIMLWDVASARLLVKGKTGGTGRPALLYAKDGDCLMAGSKTLATFDAKTLERVKNGPKFKGHKAPPNAIAWSPDGGRLLSAGGSLGDTGDCYLRAWNAATGEAVAKVKLVARKAFGVLDLLVDPRGRWVATSGEDLFVRLHDLEDLSVRHTFELPGPPAGFPVAFRSLAANPSGDHLAVSASDGRVYLLDTREPEAGHRTELAPPALAKRRALEDVASDGLCFAPDGRHLIIPRVYAYEDGYVSGIEVADVESLEVVARHPTEATAYRRAQIMPDGEHLLTIGDTGAQRWPLRELLPWT